MCRIETRTVTEWYSVEESGNPSTLPFSYFKPSLFQVALPAKGVSKRRPVVVASKLRSQPLPHVSWGVRSPPRLLGPYNYRDGGAGRWAGLRGGVSLDPSSPRLRAPPGFCRKRSPNLPFTLFSSSAQVQCDSYSARELAGAAAAAAAASASARNAPLPRYIPGKVRAGAELHRDFLLVVHPERAPEKAAREQPNPTRRWEHK